MGLVMEQLGIHIILLIVCLYYGIRMIITRDAGMLFGKEKKTYKNEREYMKCAGVLVILLGVASILMGVISLFNVIFAFIIFVISIVGIGILWKIINQKYGA